MPTSALYISVNKCKNQRQKVMQPATKQSTGLFLPNLQTNLGQLVVGSSPLIEWKIRSTHTHAPKVHFTAAHQGCATCYETVHRTVSAKFVLAKFGAACRWFESIDRMKNTEHTNVYSVFLAPQVGLEPTTLRLTAACSTNWAIEECFSPR